MSSVKRQLSQYSDDEIEALYVRHGENASKASSECGCGASTFRDRIRMIRSETYQKEKAKREGVQFLMDELEARGLDPTEVRIGSAVVKTQKNRYEQAQKGPDGKPVIIPLKSDLRLTTIKFSPKFEEGPKWPLIQPANIGTLIHTKAVKSEKPFKKIFFWPDTQIGFYRSIHDNSLTPFHDVKAIDIAMQMLRDSDADEVVILGDFLDLPSMSRWLQLPEFQHTMQPSIQYAYNLLANIRLAVGPTAPIHFVMGNHERRFGEYIAKSAMSSLGVRPAVIDPALIDPVTLVPLKWGWPQNSIYRVLQFEHLSITCSAEYPGGQHWITDNLVAMHQPERGVDMRATVVHGHIPKAQRSARTVHYREGAVEYDQIAIPGLMRCDDVSDLALLSRTSVPSNGTRRSWQQGVGSAILFSDNVFDVQVHRIWHDKGIMEGKLYTST